MLVLGGSVTRMQKSLLKYASTAQRKETILELPLLELVENKKQQREILLKSRSMWHFMVKKSPVLTCYPVIDY